MKSWIFLLLIFFSVARFETASAVMTPEEEAEGLALAESFPNHYTTERCSGDLAVIDAYGNRIGIFRGGWFTFFNGYRSDVPWYCGFTMEITRDVYAPYVYVFHSVTDRRLTFAW